MLRFVRLCIFAFVRVGAPGVVVAVIVEMALVVVVVVVVVPVIKKG